MTKSLDDFFEGKVKDDFYKNKEILKVIVGESPFYSGKKKEGKINSAVVVCDDVYPTKTIAFLRGNWSYNISMIGILNLLFGIQHSNEFLKFVIDNNISAICVALYLAEKYNLYFLNAYNNPKLGDNNSNVNTINKFLSDRKKSTTILFVGSEAEKKANAITCPGNSRKLFVCHPANTHRFETWYKQWILFENSEVTNTFRIFKS